MKKTSSKKKKSTAKKKKTQSRPAILGGKPAFRKLVSISSIPKPVSTEEVLNQFEDILSSRACNPYRGGADYYRLEFENILKQYLELQGREVVAITRAGIGLELLLIATKVGQDQRREVILPSFTNHATVRAVIRCGLQPVFVDIHPQTLNIDPDQVGQTISRETGAVIAVDIFGNPADYLSLELLAQKYSLQLLIDSAESLGARFDEYSIGNFGNGAVISFSFGKLVSTLGLGGALILPEKQIKNLHRDPGGRLFMNLMQEVNALAGLDQFARIDKYLRCRSRIQGHYRSGLAKIPGLSFQEPTAKSLPTCLHFPILIDQAEFGLSRDQLQEALSAEGIESRVYFEPQHLAFDCGPQYPLPNTKKVSKNILCLPVHSDMRTPTAERIVETIKKVRRNRRRISKHFVLGLKPLNAFGEVMAFTRVLKSLLKSLPAYSLQVAVEADKAPLLKDYEESSEITLVDSFSAKPGFPVLDLTQNQDLLPNLKGFHYTEAMLRLAETQLEECWGREISLSRDTQPKISFRAAEFEDEITRGKIVAEKLLAQCSLEGKQGVVWLGTSARSVNREHPVGPAFWQAVVDKLKEHFLFYEIRPPGSEPACRGILPAVGEELGSFAATSVVIKNTIAGIGIDGMQTHFAYALGNPWMVVLLGPTDSAAIVYPGAEGQMLTVPYGKQTSPCYGCGNHGYYSREVQIKLIQEMSNRTGTEWQLDNQRGCRKLEKGEDFFDCWEPVTPDAVVKRFQKLLARTSEKRY